MKTIVCDGITYNMIPANQPESQSDVMTIGKNYFIRTVTHYLLGTYLGSVNGFARMSGASWVADTGRFSEFLSTGKVNEVEYCETETPVSVNLGSVIDIWPWKHSLIAVTK